MKNLKEVSKAQRLRQASVDVLNLQLHRQKRARKRGKASNSKPGSAPWPIHPDVSPEDAAEHIRLLSERQGAD